MTDSAEPPSDLEVTFSHEGFLSRSAARVRIRFGPPVASLVTIIFLAALMSGFWSGLNLYTQIMAAEVVLAVGAFLWVLVSVGDGPPLGRRRPLEIECTGTVLKVRESGRLEWRKPLSTVLSASSHRGIVTLLCDDGTRQIPNQGELQHPHAIWLAEAIEACIPGPDEPETEEEASRNQARRAAIRALMGARDG